MKLKKKNLFNSLFKYYTIFYFIYLIITKQDIFTINKFHIAFYVLLIIKIAIEIQKEINL